jgi:hypothetical protein
MQKFLSFIITALISITAYGQQAPVFQWGAVLRSDLLTSENPINLATSIKANDNGDLFVSGTFTSNVNPKKGFSKISYNHYNAQGLVAKTPSPEGAKVSASATNNNENFFLYKLNKQGGILWQVVSNRGYVSSHYSQVAPTPDGGAFVALTVRVVTGDEFEDNRLLRLVGADGTSMDIRWTERQTNTLQGVAAKIDANGSIEWIKRFMKVDDGLIDGKSATIASYFDDIDVDSDGNYWLAGRYVKPITFDLPGGGTQTFTPHFVDGWNGDSQFTRGDALLVKLNPEGELLWKLETAGNIDYIAVNSLQYHNGQLFIYGNLSAPTGVADATVTLFGNTLNPTDRTNAWSACIDLSGNEPTARWVTLFKSLKQTNGYGGRIKVTAINYDNGALFVCGSLTGFIEVAGDTLLANDTQTGTSASYLMGFIIRQDPATGRILGKFMDPTGSLAAEIESVAFREGKVHAFGYALGGSWLHSYDEELTRITDATTFLQAGGATAWEAVFFDDQIVTVNRGRQIKDIGGTIYGAPQAFIDDDPPSYAAFILSYATDGMNPTGIPVNAYRHPNDLTIITRPAAVRITGNAPVKIFTPAGILRFSGQVNGEREIPLPTGIYIVAANGTATKIIIRN